MNDDKPAKTTLQYAPRLSLLNRIGHRRLIWAGMIVATVLAITIWTDPVIQRVTRWRAERAFRQLQATCMTYAAPADRVVYEEDLAAAGQLLKVPGYVSIVPVLPGPAPIACPSLQPPVIFAEPLWTRYASGLVPLTPAARGVAFMGERTSIAGERRLVCVGLAMEAGPSRDSGRWGLNRWLQAWSFEVGSLASPFSTPPMGQMHIDSGAKRPVTDFDPPTGDVRKPFHPPFPLRLYAGQRDPNDASRFTIPYALDGRQGVIEGALQDDGSVILTPDIGWHGRLGATVSWVPKVGGTLRLSPATIPAAP